MDTPVAVPHARLGDLLEAPDDFGEHQRCPIAVLDVGGVDHGVDEITFGIGQNVPLATLRKASPLRA